MSNSCWDRGSADDTLKAVEAGEVDERGALGGALVHGCIGINMPERHAADDDFLFGDIEDRPDHPVKVCECRLRAGVQVVTARGTISVPR
jgi:hypothetical protein